MAKWKKEELPMQDVLRGVQAKIKAEAQRKKDEGEDLGDEIDSDDDEDGGGGKRKIKGKFKKKKRVLASTAHKEQEPNVTVSVLKELFMERMHTPQARKLIRDAILFYYSAHKEV